MRKVEDAAAEFTSLTSWTWPGHIQTMEVTPMIKMLTYCNKSMTEAKLKMHRWFYVLTNAVCGTVQLSTKLD